MALEHAQPCEVVNLATFADQAPKKMANALVKNEHFEAIVMHLPASKTIPPHHVPGPIIVQCLEGKVDFSVEGDSHVMQAGDWMHLPGGASHALDAHEDSRLLVTLLFAQP